MKDMQNNKGKRQIIDLHQDITTYLKGNGTTQTSLASLYKTVKLFFGSVFVEPSPDRSFVQDQKSVEDDIAWYGDLAKHHETPFITIRAAADLQTVFAGDARGVLVHLEGAGALTPDNEHALESWYKQGLRSFGPLWNCDNAIGTSAASNRPKEGLTEFGKRVIKRAEQLGMLIDCAHLNEAGFYDVLEICARPPLVTHGNARARCVHPRNFTDQQIKDLVVAGGVIGVFFSAKYVRQDRAPAIDDVIGHIDHIVSLVGIDGIAIGSDFGGITSGIVQGLERLEDLERLWEELSARGYSEHALAQIFCGNALRYLRVMFSGPNGNGSPVGAY